MQKRRVKEATTSVGRGREQKGGNRRVTRKVVQLSGERDSLFAAGIKARVAGTKESLGETPRYSPQLPKDLKNGKARV